MSQTPGQMLDIRIRSGALCRPMRLHIYLPPRYGEPGLRYPVVYLLHPWGRDEHYFTGRLALHEVADRLIHAGAIPPFIAVMPQGDKSFFLNAANPGGDFTPILRLDAALFAGALEGYGDYADYLMNDVIPEVERRFAAQAHRAGRVIAGVSMGGAGAAALAFRHPESFGAVGIHSPVLFTAERRGPPWIFGLNDPAAAAQRDPAHLAGGLAPGHGLRIYLDCGLDDELAAPVGALHDELDRLGIPHRYCCRAGGHGGSYWSAHLAEYLGFYAAGW